MGMIVFSITPPPETTLEELQKLREELLVALTNCKSIENAIIGSSIEVD